MVAERTPVAVFAYNRPLHLQRALESLSRCHRRKECEFFFFLDGPRTEAVRPQVTETRKVLKEWAGSFNAQIIERDSNQGLATSIVSGVTELCGKYGRVIVLEDDLVVGTDFLHYMLESLNEYEDEENVYQVSGFTVSSPENLTTDVFLLPVTTTWGWATWQRAWEFFSWQPKDLDVAKSDIEWCRLFNLNGTCAFLKMLDDRLSGRNDSWGILWWYAVSRRQGLVAYPKTSLVWNGGFDGSGVHCGSGEFAGQRAPESLSNSNFSGKLIFPASISYEGSHLTRLENYFRGQACNKISGKIVRNIYHAFARLFKKMKP